MSRGRDLFGEVAGAQPKAVRLGRRVFLSMSARVTAETMRQQGASLAAIGKALGIAEETVRTRLKPELERGMPGGRGRGRPRWQPSAGDRARVAALSAEGVSLERIAQALGVTSPTIRRHCGCEFAEGRASAGRPR